MPADDPSLTIAFVLFLVAFVLIGIYPAWQRTAWKLRNYMNPLDNSAANEQALASLDEVEFLLLQRLARFPGKNPSAKHLAMELHLNSALVEQTLDALGSKGLVRFYRPYLASKRYKLSAKGRVYAIEQGFISNIMKRNKKTR